MPRGVYDRSKSKSQRTAEKADAPAQAAAPKRKYTKKASLTPVGSTGGEKVQADEVRGFSELKKYDGIGSNGQSRKSELAGALRLLSEIRPGLGGAFATTALDSLFAKTLSEYEKQLFPVAVQEAKTVETVQTAPAPSIGNGAPVPAPVAVAPVPFNPPTFTPAPAQG